MVAVNYLWDDEEDNIIREYDDVVNTIVEYTTEPELYGNVISQNRGGTTSYLDFDAQGNMTELTNSAGVVTDRIRYSAFGEVMERTGTTDIRFQYGGKLGYYGDNDTAILSIRRRPLSPSEGRWLSTDPLGIATDLNLFRYVAGSPLTRTDPSGLFLCADRCKSGDHEEFVTGTALMAPGNDPETLEMLKHLLHNDIIAGVGWIEASKGAIWAPAVDYTLRIFIDVTNWARMRFSGVEAWIKVRCDQCLCATCLVFFTQRQMITVSNEWFQCKPRKGEGVQERWFDPKDKTEEDFERCQNEGFKKVCELEQDNETK